MTRADIRAYFDHEAAAYPPPAGLRASVIAGVEQAAPEPRRSARFAAVFAAVVAVALAAGLIAFATFGRQAIPGGPQQRLEPPGVLPAGQPLDADLDFTSGTRGWVLLERCASSKCTYAVTHTIGGGIWSAPVQVGPSYASTNGDAPRSIHFVNSLDGFVYGHLEAFVTHDGGRTWRSAGLSPGEVVGITGTGTAWAITRPCAKGVQCAYTVKESFDGGRTWKPAAPLPDGFMPEAFASFGKGGLLVSGVNTGDMAETLDGGATWKPIRGSCPDGTAMNRVSTLDGIEIWQVCTPVQPPAVTTGDWASVIRVSENSGATWSSGERVAAGTVEILALTSQRSGILATNTAGIQITIDGGKSWSQVLNDPHRFGVQALSWRPDGQVWALDVAGTIWASADGGGSWTAIAKAKGSG